MSWQHVDLLPTPRSCLGGKTGQMSHKLDSYYHWGQGGPIKWGQWRMCSFWPCVVTSCFISKKLNNQVSIFSWRLNLRDAYVKTSKRPNNPPSIIACHGSICASETRFGSTQIKSPSPATFASRNVCCLIWLSCFRFTCSKSIIWCHGSWGSCTPVSRAGFNISPESFVMC